MPKEGTYDKTTAVAAPLRSCDQNSGAWRPICISDLGHINSPPHIHTIVSLSSHFKFCSPDALALLTKHAQLVLRKAAAGHTKLFSSGHTWPLPTGDLGKMALCGQQLSRKEPDWAHLIGSRSKKTARVNWVVECRAAGPRSARYEGG